MAVLSCSRSMQSQFSRFAMRQKLHHRSNSPFGRPGCRMEIAGPGSFERELQIVPAPRFFAFSSEGGTLSPPNIIFLARCECTGSGEEINCLVRSFCQSLGQNIGFRHAKPGKFHITDCGNGRLLERRLIRRPVFQKMIKMTVRHKTFSVAHAPLAPLTIFLKNSRKKCKFTIA